MKFVAELDHRSGAPLRAADAPNAWARYLLRRCDPMWYADAQAHPDKLALRANFTIEHSRRGQIVHLSFMLASSLTEQYMAVGGYRA